MAILSPHIPHLFYEKVYLPLMLLLSFDVVLNLFTSFYDENRKLSTSKRQIAYNYCFGYGFWDLLAAFPLFIKSNDSSTPSLIESTFLAIYSAAPELRAIIS